MASVYEWNFNGKNADDSFLSSKQIEALIAFDEFDLDTGEVNFESGCYDFGAGTTESYGAVSRIREALEKFSKLYPEVRLTVLYKYDADWYPDGFIVEGGEVVDITGHITFTRDDNGEEVVVYEREIPES